MTPDEEADRLVELAVAVDEAIPRGLRREWDARLSRQPVLVARQGIFAGHGGIFAYQLSARSPELETERASAWNAHQHERATAHVLSATFGRADLEHVAHGRPLFVRCPRAYVVGELLVPQRPDRLVVEVPAFVDRPEQRRLLPYVDFVKLDVRDLDVEGAPLVEVATSFGALLIAEFVESAEQLAHARELGITLFQGNLLERAGVLDRTRARPVSM
jgi:EAL and modified HD-GYP domain-containing signal transduction protein